ncbi:MAG: phage major capsid protein [Parvibaculales bacterium]
MFFGNIEAAYLIIERRGIQLIRDPYSKKPWILFYTTKRIGGGMQDFSAIRALKVVS